MNQWVGVSLAVAFAGVGVPGCGLCWCGCPWLWPLLVWVSLAVAFAGVGVIGVSIATVYVTGCRCHLVGLLQMWMSW